MSARTYLHKGMMNINYYGDIYDHCNKSKHKQMHKYVNMYHKYCTLSLHATFQPICSI